MNPYLCGFLFFLTFGGLNITPKNEEHEKIFYSFPPFYLFSSTGSTYIETDDL